MEFFSDNAGLKTAYKAYENYLNRRSEHHVTGYGKFTSKQAFFIAFGVVSWLKYRF